jgi:hypothetical protein
MRISALLLGFAACALAMSFTSRDAFADYESCRRSCADGFRACTVAQRAKSPDECARSANSCLYACQRSGTGTGSSGSTSRDLESCRPIIASAIAAAMRQGRSDAQVMQAGREARDRCMAGKGY